MLQKTGFEVITFVVPNDCFGVRKVMDLACSLNNTFELVKVNNLILN